MKKLILGAGVLALTGAAASYICLKEFERREQKDMNDKMIDKVESINEAVQEKADKVKGVSADAAKKASHALNDAHGRSEQMQERKEHIKKDLDAGFKKIKTDIHKTGKNISKELKSL